MTPRAVWLIPTVTTVLNHRLRDGPDIPSPSHPPPPASFSLHLLWQKITPNRKHLARHTRRKPIHLSRILLHLPRIQHALQPTRLRRQLKQPLPFVFWQRRLLRQHPACILRLPFLLPGGDFRLFARQGPLVVLVVVEFGVVGFNGFQEEVGGLGEEGVD